MSISLSEILETLKAFDLLTGVVAGTGTPNPEITRIAHDTEAVIPGALFVCVRGAKANGHSLIGVAKEKGAVAFIMQEQTSLPSSFDLPRLFVSDSRFALAAAAARFFNEPSRELLSIAVTGTNGKTSTAWIISQILSRLDIPAAYGGTFGLAHPDQLFSREADQYLVLDKFQKTKNASPDPVIMQQFLRELVDSGVKAFAQEATSQGVAQKRTRAIHWDAATFTNLTRDHLDLHGTMENYFAMKEELFIEELLKSEKPSKSAIVNIDDPWGEKLAKRVGEENTIRLFTYSRDSKRDATSRLLHADLRISGSKLTCEVNGETVTLDYRLIGAYNVENMLAAVTTVSALGVPLSKIESVLCNVPAVPGRIEIVSPERCDISVVVDYAHTPDGLIQVQQSLRPLCPGRLITLFGCGGDRDRGKRPLMAQAVRDWADEAVVTSDNPRTEAPERIIDDILPGFSLPAASERKPREFRQTVKVDRRTAIEQTILSARPGDTILVAGKGHEDYQEVAGVRHPFLDAQVCREALQLRSSR